MKILLCLSAILYSSCLGNYNSHLNNHQKGLINHFFVLAKENDSVGIKKIVIDQKNIDEEIRLAHLILTNFETPSAANYKISIETHGKFQSTIITVIFTKKSTKDKRFINGEIDFTFTNYLNNDKIYAVYVGDNDVEINNELPPLEIDSTDSNK